MTAVSPPPHRAFPKALIHLAPRSGSEGVFEGRVREVAGELTAVAASIGLDLNTLFRLANDPLGRGAPFRATVEILGEWNEAAESLTAGLGVWNFDSVSELHLESVETFLAAVADSPVPRGAMADEATSRAASGAGPRAGPCLSFPTNSGTGRESLTGQSS